VSEVNLINRSSVFRLHAEFCKTLADTSRLLIINELSKGEVPVGELAKRLNLSQSNVSKHLALMRERGLVDTRREGAVIYYSLSDRRIYEAIKLLVSVQNDQIERQHLLTSTEVDMQDIS
jgi:ArsR family transcriptional regulator